MILVSLMARQTAQLLVAKGAARATKTSPVVSFVVVAEGPIRLPDVITPTHVALEVNPTMGDGFVAAHIVRPLEPLCAVGALVLGGLVGWQVCLESTGVRERLIARRALGLLVLACGVHDLVVLPEV